MRRKKSVYIIESKILELDSCICDAINQFPQLKTNEKAYNYGLNKLSNRFVSEIPKLDEEIIWPLLAGRDLICWRLLDFDIPKRMISQITREMEADIVDTFHLNIDSHVIARIIYRHFNIDSVIYNIELCNQWFSNEFNRVVIFHRI